ncbi:MAG: hypothetical protein ACI4TG_07220, partial [Ruminococcus sp.]
TILIIFIIPHSFLFVYDCKKYLQRSGGQTFLFNRRFLYCLRKAMGFAAAFGGIANNVLFAIEDSI